MAADCELTNYVEPHQPLYGSGSRQYKLPESQLHTKFTCKYRICFIVFSSTDSRQILFKFFSLSFGIFWAHFTAIYVCVSPVGEVASGTVAAVSTMYMALENSSKILANNIANNTVMIVSHK